MAKPLVDGKAIAEFNALDDNGSVNQDLGKKISTLGYDEAVIEAKRILGTTRYDEVVALGTADASYVTLTKVLARFSFWAAFPMLNLRLTEKGGFIRSIGLAETSTELMSRREMAAYRSDLYRKAKTLLETLHTSVADQPYATTPEEDTVYVL